jgi:hypothetical protein
MARCFKCRIVTPRSDTVYAPICGAADTHPHCNNVPWHTSCREEWLADLAIWADIASHDDGSTNPTRQGLPRNL